MSEQQRVTFRLREDLYAQLKMLSDQRGESMSKIVREILERYLDRLY